MRETLVDKGESPRSCGQSWMTGPAWSVHNARSPRRSGPALLSPQRAADVDEAAVHKDRHHGTYVHLGREPHILGEAPLNDLAARRTFLQRPTAAKGESRSLRFRSQR